MCGILGVINGESGYNNNLCGYMANGAITGILRGVDSTGMFQVRKDHSVAMHKMPVDGMTFALTKRTGTLIRNVDSTLATILHHRAATHGEVKYENTHPFEHETEDSYVVGVHNGTLYNHTKQEDGLQFEVDSDWAYYMIAKHGAKKALEEHIKGSYAMVWYDGVSKTMNLAANGTRDLHFAFVQDKNVMLIASEAGMLYWLAKRNNIEVEKVLYPGKDLIYHFPFNGLRKFTGTELTPPKPPVIGGPANAPFAQRGRHRSGPTTNTDTRGQTSGTTTKRTQEYVGVQAVDRLNSIGLELNEEVELFFDKDKIVVSEQSDIPIEYMNKKGEVGKGLLAAMSGVLRYNLSKSKLCKSRVYGVRQNYDSQDVPCGFMVLFGKPTIVESVEVTSEDIRQEDEEELADGPNRRRITREEFQKLAIRGCVGCNDDIDWQDALHGNIGWVGEEPMCQSCCLPVGGHLFH